jgi:hypothetical protein
MALVYWLAFLEIDPDVESFCLGNAEQEFDFSVTKRDDTNVKIRFCTRIDLVENKAAAVTYISRDEVLVRSSLAIKVMKPLAFAAAIAYQECTSTSNVVRAFEVSQKSGSIKDLIENFPNLDVPVVCGVLVRHFIAGLVSVDLPIRPFGVHTRWECR